MPILNQIFKIRNLPIALLLLLGLTLSGCAGRIDSHGHILNKEDLNQVQVGAGRDVVQMALGTPDTSSTIGNLTYYYISSKKKTVSLFKPKTIDRKVVAIYFDQNERVSRIANYGLKDGKVFDFHAGKTPSHGNDISLIYQLLGNLGKGKLMP